MLFGLCGLLGSEICDAQYSGNSYQKIVREMETLQTQYTDWVQLISLGANDQGEEIWGMRIEFAQSFMDEKTPHLLVATHHGNERDAAPLSMAFARQVLKDISTGDLRGDILAAGIYYIFPVLNISGYNSNRRNEKDATGRQRDPNRDYPDACIDTPYFKLKSTSLLAEFIAAQKIVSAVTVHGYVGTFTYPWGFFTEAPRTPDNDIYHKLLSYAVEVNYYRVGNHKDAIYPATGSFEDWAYNALGVWVALLEMKYNLDYNSDVEALIRFFTRVPKERSWNHTYYGRCSDQSMLRSASPSRP